MRTMLKLSAARVAVLAALALAALPAAASGGNVTPRTIDDRFAGSSIDSNVWA